MSNIADSDNSVVAATETGGGLSGQDKLMIGLSLGIASGVIIGFITLMCCTQRYVRFFFAKYRGVVLLAVSQPTRKLTLSVQEQGSSPTEGDQEMSDSTLDALLHASFWGQQTAAVDTNTPPKPWIVVSFVCLALTIMGRTTSLYRSCSGVMARHTLCMFGVD